MPLTFDVRVLHPVARRAKLADLEDNMDLGRISNPKEKDLAHIEKYRSAHVFLMALDEGQFADAE